MEKVDDLEMEISDDPDKQERENIDKAKMDKIALQSQIEPDDEDEEISHHQRGQPNQYPKKIAHEAVQIE